MSVKCLVIGDINGQVAEVFKKISSLHAKNSFAFAVIAGNLFTAKTEYKSEDGADSASETDALLNGSITIPLPTYFCLGKTALPAAVTQKLSENNNELCGNLFFLGRRTTIKTSEGVRIVALGGALDPQLAVDTSKDAYAPFHSAADGKGLKGANSADILITSDWPKGIRTRSKTTPADVSDVTEQEVVAELCTSLKPRYHFSTSAAFYEREPFFHPPADGADGNDSPGHSITRFLSLAPFGNGTKQKWIYAFTLDPSSAPAIILPPGTTASPLTSSSKKRPAQPAQDTAFSRFSGASTSSARPPKRRRQPPPGPSECFFCLSNPSLAAHLVTSIGEDAYMTTAKGPLTLPTTFLASHLPLPAHMLIVPLPHAPTLASIPDPAARTTTLREMRHFRSAVHDMLRSVGGGELGAVTWEVARAGGVHAHWQVLPVPAGLVRRGLVEAAFTVEGENEEWPAFEGRDVDDDEDGEVETGDHFSVWIWSPPPKSEEGSESKIKDEDVGEHVKDEDVKGVRVGASRKLTLPLDGDAFRFDLQFGRRVLAKLLGLEKRTHWRDCEQSEVEESADAEGWKEVFRRFDFTLE